MVLGTSILNDIYQEAEMIDLAVKEVDVEMGSLETGAERFAELEKLKYELGRLRNVLEESWSDLVH
jgi:hypothetical protein